MRRLILDHQNWSDDEKRKILEYCASDVTGTVALFSKMAPSIDWPRALLRGRYMKAVARMERTGVPIDTGTLHKPLIANWDSLKEDLIAAVDVDYGVYEGTTFKASRFAEFLSARGIAWPKYPDRGVEARRLIPSAIRRAVGPNSNRYASCELPSVDYA